MDLDGSWLSLLVEAPVNASWTQAAAPGLSRRVQLVLEVLMVLMCLGAVTGNILVIIIVAATKTFHSVRSVLIMNLAVSDLLVGIGAMPFVALSVMNHGWVDVTNLCLYVGYTSSVYCTASVLTLAAIALDRYHSIMYCLHYSSRCTLWRTFAVVLWIWLQALATSCPPLLGWGSINYMDPMYICAVNWASGPSYIAFMSALSYLLPAVVILFCYVNIVKVARSHARRIHTLEDSLQRSRDSSSASGDSSHQNCVTLHGPSELIYHVSGQFVSEVRREEVSHISSALPDSATEQNHTKSRRVLSFLSQSASQSPMQNSQQHHQGVVRLFLVISAFFLCWTPFIGVTVIQATESAITGQPSLVPPSAVTFSYWLLLLNSDINPLLYALLSQRFQGALLGLRHKIRARLGSMVGRNGGVVRTEGDEQSTRGPCTLTTAPPGQPFNSETCDDAKYSSTIFTVSTDFKQNSEKHLYNTSPSCSMWQDAGGETKLDYLHVPSGPQEGRRLPFSALTNERQATFFYGQITVRVEHDVC